MKINITKLRSDVHKTKKLIQKHEYTRAQEKLRDLEHLLDVCDEVLMNDL